MNASGGGDYTYIQWAIDNASEGDTVFVESGVYYENIRINKTINLIGNSRKNTTIYGERNYRIVAISADWVNISGFRLTNGSTGIYLFNSSHCQVENNNCSNNQVYGIRVEGNFGHSNNNSIKNNTCNANGRGMSFIANIGLCNDNIIINNTCNSNIYDGIELYIMWGLCDRNFIFNNICSYNGNSGIEAQESDGNNISYNICIDNSGYAICLNGGTNNNIIHLNTIINNNGSDLALDHGKENLWNTSKEGNYWSNWTTPDNNRDGIVDKPYIISGTANAMDYFPFITPPDMIIPIANAGIDTVIDQYETVFFNSSGCLNTNFIKIYTWRFVYNNEPHFLFGPSPNFTFHTPGRYVVKLSVKNSWAAGTNDTTMVTVIDITPPLPVPGIDLIIYQHHLVLFNASESTDNDAIINFTWSFIYDNTDIALYGKNVAFTFHSSGKYVLTLNVTDAEGNWATDTINVTVLDITPPIATAGENITTFAGETVFLNASGSRDNVGIVNYTWSFSYNWTDIELYGVYQSFVFAQPGSYNITLTVYDHGGNYGRDKFTVLVFGEPIPLDSDDDGYPDDYEVASGSDPNDLLSTPLDIDGDTFNNTFENASGSNPLNSTSIPSDRDGDSYPNKADAYPDDPTKWEWEPENDLSLPDDGEIRDEVGMKYIRTGIIVLSVVITSSIILTLIFLKKKEKRAHNYDEDLGRIDVEKNENE